MQGSEQWYRVLGLAPGANQQAIKEAHRDLVKVWHPDRFGSDERLRQKAEQKLTEINEAFEYLSGRRKPPRSSAPSATEQPDAASANAWRTIAMALVWAAVASVTVWLVLASRRDAEPARAASPPAPPASSVHAHVPPTPQPLTKETKETNQTGSISISSQPAGSRVSLDGDAVGETPVRITDITPGDHLIRITARGYESWTSSIAVGAGREEKVLAVMARRP